MLPNSKTLNCDKICRQKIPPDGGWGWIIVGANIVSNIMSLPLITSFGLLFKDKLQMISMPATDISMIININSAFGMSMGIITGPLLKKFGYRKIGCAAGFLFASGVVMTAFATTFTHFIITYSLITAAGYGLTTASFYLALNTYFKERRSKAAGVTMALSGIGPIIYPPMITYLLSKFSVTGSVLILGGLSFNIVVAAILLQPIKYHYIVKPIFDEQLENERTIVILNNIDIKKTEYSTSDKHRQSLSDQDSSEENEDDYLESMQKLYDFEHFNEGCHESTKNVNTKNLELKEKQLSLISIPAAKTISTTSTKNITFQKYCKNSAKWIINFFDLDLLRDKIFLNIIVGMAIATFSEINFSVLTPFILSEMNYTTLEIATALSSVGISDIISRFFAPFIGDILHIGPRGMYMLSLSGLIIARTSYLAVTNYKSLIILSIGLGFAKGIRTVYMILVIPEHVTIEKLPSANGIRMVFNCIMLLLLGIIVGRIVDIYGSYLKCILFINFMTFICIAMWAIEMIYVKYRSHNKV